MQHKTPLLGLDYLLPEQAQKHVTVNDGLRRLDGLVQLSVKNRITRSPPDAPNNGDRYLIGDKATGAWEMHDGELALFEDTAWAFIAPQTGWLLWDEADARLLVRQQNAWQAVAAETAAPARHYIETLETVFEPAAGLGALTIPSHITLLGVTAKVLEALTGAKSWQLGTERDSKRFGSGLAVAVDTEISGPSDPPQVYWQAENIALAAQGGSFTGGRVAVAVHMLRLPMPDVGSDVVTL